MKFGYFMRKIANKGFKEHTPPRVGVLTSIRIECPNQFKVGFSYNLFFPGLIISRQIKQRSVYKQPPEKVHGGLLPSLSLCRSCEVDIHGALGWYVPS